MPSNKAVGPFAVRKDFEGKSDFDQYYFDVIEKEVFKATGDVDPETGEALGVIDKKLIIKKISIHDFLESQRDTVGVEAYIKALTLQGEDIGDYNTSVDPEKVQDFSNLPDTLADTLMLGDKARVLFNNLDPALKGSHTTIEGFLSSLNQEALDKYILSRIEVLTGNIKKDGE